MEFILLVEDDADVRLVMKEMLTGSPFTILEAESAAEALKVLRKGGGSHKRASNRRQDAGNIGRS